LLAEAGGYKQGLTAEHEKEMREYGSAAVKESYAHASASFGVTIDASTPTIYTSEGSNRVARLGSTPSQSPYMMTPTPLTCLVIFQIRLKFLKLKVLILNTPDVVTDLGLLYRLDMLEGLDED
jgi:hypothetical protein